MVGVPNQGGSNVVIIRAEWLFSVFYLRDEQIWILSFRELGVETLLASGLNLNLRARVLLALGRLGDGRLSLNLSIQGGNNFEEYFSFFSEICKKFEQNILLTL